MSEMFSLSANANILSFSISLALDDFVSGQKNILIPEGVSGKSQKKSQFHRMLMKKELGLKATFSASSLCKIISLALNWLFFAWNAV